MKKYTLLLVFALIQLSCSDKTVDLKPTDILGEWHTENAFINGSPASDFLDGGKLYSSILGLQKDDFYFLNYNSGSWSLDRNILTLSNKGKFEIISYNDSLMTMKRELLAIELFTQLYEIPDNETITLIEDYRRR